MTTFDNASLMRSYQVLKLSILGLFFSFIPLLASEQASAGSFTTAQADCAKFMSDLLTHFESPEFGHRFRHYDPALVSFFEETSRREESNSSLKGILSKVLFEKGELNLPMSVNANFHAQKIIPTRIYPNGVIDAQREISQGNSRPPKNERTRLAAVILSPNFWENPYTMMSWRKVEGPVELKRNAYGVDELRGFTHFSGRNDVSLYLDDAVLFERYLEPLDKKLTHIENRAELYELLARQVYEVVLESGQDHDDHYGVSIGEQLARFGGDCREASALTYLYLNGIRKIPAYFEASDPKKWSAPLNFDGHLYIRTADDYIIDSAVGLAFPVTYDSLRQLIIPDSIKAVVRKKFKDPRKAEEIIEQLTLHYRRSEIAPENRNSLYSRENDYHAPLFDQWSQILFYSEAEVSEILRQGDIFGMTDSKRRIFLDMLQKFKEIDLTLP